MKLLFASIPCNSKLTQLLMPAHDPCYCPLHRCLHYTDFRPKPWQNLELQVCISPSPLLTSFISPFCDAPVSANAEAALHAFAEGKDYYIKVSVHDGVQCSTSVTRAHPAGWCTENFVVGQSVSSANPTTAFASLKAELPKNEPAYYIFRCAFLLLPALPPHACSCSDCWSVHWQICGCLLLPGFMQSQCPVSLFSG